MWRMKISATNDFVATVDEVYAMVTDTVYLDALCVAAGAVSHQVAIDGRVTVSDRVLPAPSLVQKFAGETLAMTETVSWAEKSADGTVPGQLTLRVVGLPATLTADVSIAPGGRGTLVDYAGNLVVDIPFLGRKLEEAAAPAILEFLVAQQGVGDDYLSRRAAQRSTVD